MDNSPQVLFNIGLEDMIAAPLKYRGSGIFHVSVFLEVPRHFLLSSHFLEEMKDGTHASWQESLLQQYYLMKDGWS